MKSLKSKIDAYLWAFMWVLPVVMYFIAFYRSGTWEPFDIFIDGYSFPFVRNVINNVWETAFGEYFYLAGYISYLVSIEVVHCLFDVIVFIPRIAHSFVDRAVGFAGGEKK